MPIGSATFLDDYIAGRTDLAASVPRFDDLPDSLQHSLRLIAPAHSQVVIFAGPDLRAFYNAAYAPTIGDKHPAAFGQPAGDYWTELWHDLEPMLRDVLAKGITISAQDRPFYIERFGYPETVYFNISYSPIRAADGKIDAVLCLVTETTARVNALDALRQNEARMAAVVEGATVGLGTLDAMGRVVMANSKLAEILGVPLDQLLGRQWHGLAQSADDPPRPLLPQEMMARGVHEHRYIRQDGSSIWISQSLGAINPHRSAGAPQAGEERYCLIVIDNSHRRKTDAQILQQAAIIDGSDDAIISIDLDLRITSWNDGATRLYGYQAEEVLGQPMTPLLPLVRRREDLDILARIRAGEKVCSYETSRIRKDGREVPISLTVSPIYDEDGAIIGASKIGRDDSPRLEAARLQEVLLREMKHRVKNILASVLAIARQTLGDMSVPQNKVFTERVLALARAQDLLTRTPDDGAQLHDLVAEIISPYTPERFNCSGPPVSLNSQMVMSLTLALHELATNAAKYGALSVDSGRIELCWRLGPDAQKAADDRVLVLEWIERGGPVVVKPARRGFGTMLLRDVPTIELQADIGLEYHPSGLRYTAKIPVSAQA